MKEKISKYRNVLEEQLKELLNERKALLDKFTEGEMLEETELTRNQELSMLIKEIKEELSQFSKLDLIEEMKISLSTLAKSEDEQLEKQEKLDICNRLYSQFIEIIKDKEHSNSYISSLTEEELENLETTVKDLEEEISDIKAELRYAKRRGLDYADIENELKDAKSNLDQVVKYQNCLQKSDKIKSDLMYISDSYIPRDLKDRIVVKYEILLVNFEEYYINKFSNINYNIVEDEVLAENIIQENEIEDEVLAENIIQKNEVEDEAIIINDSSFEEGIDLDEEIEDELFDSYDEIIDPEEELNDKSNKLTKTTKTVLKICGTVILATAIILASKGIKNSIENNKNNNIDDNYTIGQNHIGKENITELTNKGYSEYASTLMVETFKENTIKSLLEKPYISAVENYVTESEFNVDYINDYENARTIYNLTPSKTVDYVNRSYKIQETGFYNDAEINEIVEVIKDIDTQVMRDSSVTSQSINATLTEIYNNYTFGKLTDADSKKIDALNYFAKDGSELDLFLTKYSSLVKDVLNSQNDLNKGEETKNVMYNYLDTFANTFAGNTVGVTNIDENAVITDTYDWGIAFTSFIRPLMSMYITKNNVNDYVCLQINMISNYEQWAQLNGNELAEYTLGGE